MSPSLLIPLVITISILLFAGYAEWTDRGHGEGPTSDTIVQWVGRLLALLMVFFTWVIYGGVLSLIHHLS